MKRRNILKRIGVGAGFGLTADSVKASSDSNKPKSSVFGLEDRSEIVAPYTDVKSVQKLVGKYASEVLSELRSQGFISYSDPRHLDLSTYVKDDVWRLAPESSHVGFGVSSYNKDGVLTAHVMISQANSEYNYGIYIQPEVDRAYGIVATNDDREKILIDPRMDSTIEPSDYTCEQCTDFCSEDYRCGSLCESSCVPTTGGCCDYESIKESTYYGSEGIDCCCTVEEVIECGTAHDSNGNHLVDCTDCYDTIYEAPCC